VKRGLTGTRIFPGEGKSRGRDLEESAMDQKSKKILTTKGTLIEKMKHVCDIREGTNQGELKEIYDPAVSGRRHGNREKKG